MAQQAKTGIARGRGEVEGGETRGDGYGSVWKDCIIFRAAVRQIFVDCVRVNGAAGSSMGFDDEVVVGASGVQQERIAGTESSCKEGMLGAEFIGVSLEQQSS